MEWMLNFIPSNIPQIPLCINTRIGTDDYISIHLAVEHWVTSTGWAKKTGPFLNDDNFATVSGRKACDMSKVCKFCLEKSVKLA